jgi:hypothetical protein
MQSKTGSVQIYPAFINLEIKDETPVEFELTIKNDDETDIKVDFTAAKFEQKGQNLANQISDLPFYENVFSFPNGQEKLTVKAETQKAFTFELDPEKIGKYPFTPTIIAQIQGPAAEGETNLNFEYAVPIYVKNSQLEETIEIKNFEIKRKIIIGKESYFSSTIKNTGKTYLKPRGYIELHQLNLFNDQKTRIKSIPITNKPIILLPGSNLKKDYTWEREEFGHYQASIYAYSQNSEPINQTIDFWLIPSSFLIKASLIFLAVIALITLILRARKKRFFQRLLNKINIF